MPPQIDAHRSPPIELSTWGDLHQTPLLPRLEVQFPHPSHTAAAMNTRRMMARMTPMLSVTCLLLDLLLAMSLIFGSVTLSPITILLALSLLLAPIALEWRAARRFSDKSE